MANDKTPTEQAVNATVTFLAVMFLSPVLGVLFGALSGWTIGLFFTEEIFDGFRRFGIDTTGWPMWQIGVFFGFIAAFFKAVLTK